MLKINHKLCPETTSDIFTKRTNSQYSFRNRPDFINPQVLSVFYGKSISYLGHKIWGIAPAVVRQKKSLSSFKESIKMWVPTNCPCRLREAYVDGVGFINRI